MKNPLFLCWAILSSGFISAQDTCIYVKGTTVLQANHSLDRAYSGVIGTGNGVLNFGGAHGTDQGNDVWYLNDATYQWAQISPRETCTDPNLGCNAISGGSSIPDLTATGAPYVIHSFQMYTWDPIRDAMVLNHRSAGWFTFTPSLPQGTQWKKVGTTTGMADIDTGLMLDNDPDNPGAWFIQKWQNPSVYRLAPTDITWSQMPITLPHDSIIGNWGGANFSTYIPDLKAHLIVFNNSQGKQRWFLFDLKAGTFTAVPSLSGFASQNFQYDPIRKFVLGFDATGWFGININNWKIVRLSGDTPYHTGFYSQTDGGKPHYLIYIKSTDKYVYAPEYWDNSHIQIFDISQTLPNISGNTGICNGASTTLTASGGVSFSWNTGSTAASIVVNPNASTYYSVEIANSNGCKTSDSVQVTVGTGASVNSNSSNASCSTCCDGLATALATGTGPFSYIWSPGGQTAATATGLCAGTYSVCVTDGAGCAVCKSAVVGLATGISDSFSADAISIYPNPFSEQTLIRVAGSNLQATGIKVFDVLGNEVKVQIVHDRGAVILSRGELSSGIYFLKIISDATVIGTQKLIIR